MDALLIRIFRVLARLAIARGVLFPRASECLKHGYLQAARDALAGERITDSRLSVMTGLQRRDIGRLKAEPKAANPPGSPLTRLLQVWHGDPQYSGRPLPRRGEAPSFETLARAVRQDVHPRTLFDQLTDAGAVTYDTERDMVTPVQRSYQPKPGTDEQLGYLSNHLADHGSAAIANVLSEKAPFFDRSVHFTGLSPEAVTELDAAFREGEMALMAALADRAQILKQTSPGATRFRAGGYFYQEEEECR